MLLFTIQGKTKTLLAEHWGIILITALAAFLRFSFLDTTRYIGDYTYPTYQALQILEEGKFLTIGREASNFISNPPLMAYLQALPLLLSHSLLSVVLRITILNLLGVPLTYLLGLRLFDKKTGLAAAFLYAVNPWAVYFTYQGWEQGLLPFFSSLVAYLLFPALSEGQAQGRRVFFGLVAAAIMTQTYILAYAVLAQVAILLLFFRRRLSLRPILAGVIFFGILSLPYHFSLLSQFSTTFKDAGGLLSGSPVLDAEALINALRLVSGAGYPLDPSYLPDESWRTLLFQLATSGITILVAWGVGESVWKVLHRQPAATHLLCLIWFFTPILLMTFHTVGLAIYYLFLTYPAGFIFAGLGARNLRNLWRSNFHILMVILAIGLAFLFGGRMAQVYEQAASHPTRGNLEFVPRPFSLVQGFEALPLRYALSVGQVIRDTTLAVYMREVSPWWVSAISGTLIEPYSDFEEDRFLVLRANHPALYVLLDPKELSPAFSFSQELLDKQIDLPNDGSIRFFLFPPRSQEQLASLPSHPLNLPLNTGWTLLGYDLPPPTSTGDSIYLSTYWLVHDLPPPRDRNSIFLKPFAHLIDDQGNVLALGDGHGQAGNLWRKGDFYIDTLSVVMPNNAFPGDYWLSLGLYDPNVGLRATFPNGEDNLLIGPLRIE